MAFTGGIKRPQASTSNNNNTQQNYYDRLVTIVSYNTESRKMIVEDDKQKKYEVFVNPKEYLRAEESVKNLPVDRTTTWMGHSIDKQMEKNYPVGSKIILQKSKVLKNNNGVAETEVQRIHGVPNAEPDKTFQGIVTVTARTDENRLKRIARVQHWNANGIDVNNSESLEALAKEIDKGCEGYLQTIGKWNVTLPTTGVQFRALMKTDRTYALNNTPIYEAVNFSIPFDWMPGPDDENGKEIKDQAHPMTGKEMLDFVEAYIDYISNHEQFKDHLDDMLIEVAPYRSYPASNNKQLQLTFGDPQRDANADKNPLFQLANQQNYLDIEQSDKLQGRNYAVNGIIQLSPNKYEKVNGVLTEIPSYWVNNLHVNHTKGHVHAMVRTQEGFKVDLHPNLKLIYNRKAENTDQNDNGGSEPQNQKGQYSAPQRAPAQPRPVQNSQESDEFDPFAADSAAPAPAPSTNNEQKNAPRFGRRG